MSEKERNFIAYTTQNSHEDSVRRKICRNSISRRIKIKSLKKLVALMKWVGKNYWKIGEDEVSLSFNYLIVNQPLDKSNG
jgi:hypothetical protein